MCRVTLTTPSKGKFVIQKLGLIVYLCAKFDDSSFSRSTDISFLGAPKFKVDQVTLTTPLLRVICHSYAGT